MPELPLPPDCTACDSPWTTPLGESFGSQGRRLVRTPCVCSGCGRPGHLYEWYAPDGQCHLVLVVSIERRVNQVIAVEIEKAVARFFRELSETGEAIRLQNRWPIYVKIYSLDGGGLGWLEAETVT